MKTMPKDYLILEVGGKFRLARCTSIEPFQATLELEDQDGRPVPVEFTARDIVANLGKSPKYGTAFGVQIEIMHKRFSHDWFGDIEVYRAYPEETILAFKKCLQKIAREIERRKLPQLPLKFEVRNPKGKYAGHYKHRPGKETDTLVVRLGEDDISIENMTYVVAHEYAHGIWFRHLSLNQRSKWISLYHDAMTVTQVEEKELKSLLDDLIAEQSITQFYKLVSEEDKVVLRAVFKHIKATHGLDKHHIQLLLSLEEDVSNVWPTYLEVGDTGLIVSDYAKKSPEECWAECFAFWFEGKKLPKRVSELLDSSLRKLIKNIDSE